MARDDFQRNRLTAASSPYLRQHADNPVHWQPWEEATLEHARALDVPIVLSIGYSACHWCHVMAHECFEDAAIAATMNESFVNIKLDREERPDIDQVYQLAHQALTGRGGGWPLTVFADPQNLSPFFIGTYFPPVPARGLPGFDEVLRRVRVFFDEHRDQLRAQADELHAWLQHIAAESSPARLDARAVQARARQHVAARFDPRWGGARGAPKFPRAMQLEWLLDAGRDDASAHAMAGRTLATMAARGLQDHLGGGFFRYCTDESWTIPHFEKMLYDNAQLLPVYARWVADAKNDVASRAVAQAAARGIVDWLERAMRTSEGMFFSSLDADSEGGEGDFYLWSDGQMRSALPEALADLAEQAFGLDAPPNFEGRAWHLMRAHPLTDLVTLLDRSTADVEADLAKVRALLFQAREKRAPPARDDKVLTAWNALAIAGLARSARLLQDDRCADLARGGLAALREAAWHDGALAANAAPAASRIPGFLDDHAFVLDALLEVLQLRFDADELGWAIALADLLMDRFADVDGAFRFSTPAHATPLVRARPFTDDALPNGNAVAVRSLLRLGHLVGETRYLEAADRALHAAAGVLERHPEACCSLLRALHEWQRPRPQVVVRCGAAAAGAWRAAAELALRGIGLTPGGDAADVFVIPDTLSDLPGVLDQRVARGAAGTAYVCAGLACQAPVTSVATLAQALRESVSAPTRTD